MSIGRHLSSFRRFVSASPLVAALLILPVRTDAQVFQIEGGGSSLFEGYGGLVNFRVGEAVQALRETPGPFDLIFNDIDKEGYPASLPVIADKLRPGGLLIIDNMLWSGRVLTDDDNSSATAGIRRLTAMLTGNGDWSASLVPIRDGLMLAIRN